MQHQAKSSPHQAEETGSVGFNSLTSMNSEYRRLSVQEPWQLVASECPPADLFSGSFRVCRSQSITRDTDGRVNRAREHPRAALRAPLLDPATWIRNNVSSWEVIWKTVRGGVGKKASSCLWFVTTEWRTEPVLEPKGVRWGEEPFGLRIHKAQPQ